MDVERREHRTKKRIWKNKNMKQYLVNMKVNICQLKILLFHICLHLNTPTSKKKLITYYKRPEPLFFHSMECLDSLLEQKLNICFVNNPTTRGIQSFEQLND